MAEPQLLRDLFTVAERFHRSVNIALDFAQIGSLEGYILTPLNQAVLERIMSGLRSDQGARSWTLTGPYGAGKSASVLFMAEALGYPVQFEARGMLQQRAPELYKQALQVLGSDINGLVMVPMVCSRQPLALILLEGIGETLRRFRSSSDVNEVASFVKGLRGQAMRGEVVAPGQVAEAVERTAKALQRYEPRIRGLVLVLDELGRSLEFTALYPEKGDIELLQTLAEIASRSKSPVIALLTVLHQAFEHYAASLTPTQQREWSKVKGRFEEIGFLESPGELLSLISEAIRISPYANGLATAIAAQIEPMKELELLPHDLSQAEGIKVLKGCAPLHPTVALLLGPLFRSRLAQNERSLFAFLCSGEPHGFQEHLGHETWGGDGDIPFYRLDALYDYVISALGSSLYTQSHSKRWAEIEDALDRLPDEAVPLHMRLVKAIGLLNLLGDKRSLRASESVLVYALGDLQTTKQTVHSALEDLQSWGIAVYRRFRDSYNLWEGSDVDLDACYERGMAQLDRSISLAALLQKGGYLKSYIAKRHLHETGTLRHLAPRVIDLVDLEEVSRMPLDGADGLVVFVLPPQGMKPTDAVEQVHNASASLTWPRLGQILYAIPHYYHGLREAMEEMQVWDWVAKNTPALEGDSVARRELTARRVAGQTHLDRAVARAFEPSSSHLACTWIWKGQVQQCETRGALARLVSELCDEVYAKAPIILNELINRRTLSSAAAAARRTLIERMLSQASEEKLGIEGFPPEMSIFLSVLGTSGLHQRKGDSWIFGPPLGADSNRVHPLWNALEEFVTTSESAPIPVNALYEWLRQPPFGVRDGLLPIYLTAFIVHGEHEIALYEEGTFVPEVRIAEFERLLRAPERFTIQRYPLNTVHARLLTGYVRLFAPNAEPATVTVLNAVRGLLAFIGHLPRYAQYTNSLTPKAKVVRQTLLSARQPHPLLFTDLPRDMGFEALSDNENAVDEYLDEFRRVLLELNDAYDVLLKQVQADLCVALRLPADLPSARKLIGQRTGILTDSITELGLKAFATRLGDQRLPDREWLESIAAVVVNKPLRSWTDLETKAFRGGSNRALRAIAS